MSFEPAYLAFVEETKNPEEAHLKAWQRIWAQIEKSPFWAQKKISKTGVAPDLQNFKISEYPNYLEAIEKSFQTGVSELSGDPVIFWCESSGSSGKRKIFPMTEAYRSEFQKITPPQTYLLMKNFPKFLAEPFLFFVATKPSEQSPTGVDVGFISHYNYRNIPKLLAKNYGFPLEVFQDSETFYRWGPLYALATNLSAMAAITPSMVSQLGERICAQLPDYWPYLEGKVQPPAPLPPIKVTPERLSLLKQKLGHVKTGDVFSYADVWPALQFITCWKSATCGLQVPGLERWLQNKVPLVEGAFCATEGWLSVPFGKDTDPGTILHPGSHVVEFALADTDITEKDLLKPWELTEGKNYEIFLTSSMGLIRYRIRDIMRCKGFFNRSPILEFIGKSGNMVSIGQTRVNEEHLLSAIQKANFKPTGSWVFGLDEKGEGLVFYTEKAPNDTQAALTKIDTYLCEINSEYDSDLKSGLLKPIRIQSLPSDHGFWKSSRHAQSKPKILTAQFPSTQTEP